MIDTVKIFTKISKDIYDIIYNSSVIKSSRDNSTGELIYNIVNSHLEGSYSSSLSVRVQEGYVYGYEYGEYTLTLEGSLHKIKYGYNSHCGFYDLKYLCNYLIGIVEEFYKIELPQIDLWYLLRCDIAKVYDLENQENINNYISNLRKCTFPRRKVNFYKNQSLYCSGTNTTLKIYNKLEEFKKHDISKFRNKDFDLENYINFIQGFIRFEVEIKKKKLLTILEQERGQVKVIDFSYDILLKVWESEFMKLLKICENEVIKLNENDKILYLLKSNYTPVKARNLYNFYLSILVGGIDFVKDNMSSSSYYRNLAELKNLNIDFSQTYNVEITNKYIDFNPFTFKEVA